MAKLGAWQAGHLHRSHPAPHKKAKKMNRKNEKKFMGFKKERKRFKLKLKKIQG